ncbi:DUF2214 family protein [Teredinibacter sp. KSP-S5-2]|uniref:DUF2214 family protein n=1 Tax=Teredinibacter sp. KSP-S5-2 TaxID=3034506 RepID=UPI002934BBBC|nr:DUF2214 family protein [Teredinibacter sp. KSP-S5-2]WNO09201.1 DUF2214 family protein [Teredinibacter sp. KSP-S5-2]
MLAEIIVRYFHLFGIIVLGSLMTAEHVLAKAQVSRQDFKRLAMIDMAYGICALVVFASGMTLWLGVGKPASFYSQNWIMHLKVTLFFVIALLSVYPTVFFIKNRKTESEEITLPKKIVWCIRGELTLLVIMPLLGVLLGRGVGMS